MTKKVIAVIVALVVVGGVWWYFSREQGNNAPASYGQNQNPPVATNNQNSPTSGSGNTAGNGAALVPAPSNSGASLDQDLLAIDAQMNALSSDSAAVDQGLTDQPIAQGQ